MGPKKSHAAAGHLIHLVCPHCSKEFRGNSSTSGVRSNYRRHLLVHTGERPYPCSYCGDSFTTKPNLRRHISLCHGRNVTPNHAPQPDANDVPLAEAFALDVGNTAGAPTADALPPLQLPTSTSTASPVASLASSSSKHGTALSPTSTVETTGLTSSAAASQALSENGGADLAALLLEHAPRPPSSAASTVTDTTATTATTATNAGPFICEECELEVSSRAKLHRHQRYYCPFRDNIFVDPVQDALNRYRAEHQQQGLRRRGKVTVEDEDEDDDAVSEGSDAESVDSDGRLVVKGRRSRSRSASRQRRHRHGRKSASALELTQEERSYLTRVAAQSGLKFVEDAYLSESDGEVERATHSMEYSSDSDASSAWHEEHGANDTGKSPCPHSTPSPLQSHVSPRRTPLHGPLPSPHKSTGEHLPLSLAGKGEAKVGATKRAATAADSDSDETVGDVDDDDTKSDVDPGEDLLHLHFHRRRSGHKRERRILQKRLRAQEGALLGLTNSPLRRPMRRPRVELVSSDARLSPTVDAAPQPTPNSSSAQVLFQADEHQEQQHPGSQATTIVISQDMMARADSLLTHQWRRGHRNGVGVLSEFVCPYCSDATAFHNQRQLTQHMRRMHPAEAERNANRANE